MKCILESKICTAKKVFNLAKIQNSVRKQMKKKPLLAKILQTTRKKKTFADKSNSLQVTGYIKSHKDILSKRVVVSNADAHTVKIRNMK